MAASGAIQPSARTSRPTITAAAVRISGRSAGSTKSSQAIPRASTTLRPFSTAVVGAADATSGGSGARAGFAIARPNQLDRGTSSTALTSPGSGKRAGSSALTSVRRT